MRAPSSTLRSSRPAFSSTRAHHATAPGATPAFVRPAHAYLGVQLATSASSLSSTIRAPLPVLPRLQEPGFAAGCLGEEAQTLAPDVESPNLPSWSNEASQQ